MPPTVGHRRDPVVHRINLGITRKTPGKYPQETLKVLAKVRQVLASVREVLSSVRKVLARTR